MPKDSAIRSTVTDHKVGAGMLMVGLIAAGLLAKRRMRGGADQA